MRPPLGRRRFLVASGVTGAAALAGGAGVVSWHEVAARTRTDPLPTDAAVLVLVTLYGGNDALNTVVPAGDPAYQDARPQLAYAEDAVLPLGDGLGLCPSMTGLHRLWTEDRLAVVRGVGYPRPDRSHFRSMDIWQTASPGRPVRTGWIGRWLDATGRDPLRALSLGATPPPLAVGEHATAGALTLTGVDLPGGPVGAALPGLAEPDPADTVAQAAVARATGDLFRLAGTVEPTLAGVSERDEDDEDNAGASAGGQGQLAAQLELVARLVEAGAPARVYAVSLGGFDTHADERATQERLLGQLDRAVSSFLGRMGRTERGKRVVVAVYSEFGRRVAANASQGTDHGTAGAMFVAGPAVRGGFYGEQPDLRRLTDGDLPVTTDFRAAYRALLAGVLDADPDAVVADPGSALSFLR